MRKTFLLIIYLLVAAVIVAACGSSVDEDGPPSGQGSEDFPEMTQINPAGSEPAGTVTVEGTPNEAANPGLPVGESAQTAFMVNSLLSYEVAGSNGRIGRVAGLVLEGLSGRMNYLVVETIGPQPNRRVLLPWGSFQVVDLPPEQDLAGAEPAPAVYLTVSEGDLAGAPDFDQAQVENEPQAGWDADVRKYWAGRQLELPVTGGEEQPPGGVLWIDDAVDFDVQNSQGERLGEVEDLVVMPDGSLGFALLEPDSVLDLGEDRVAVAWKALGWIPDQRVFVLHADADSLQDAPRVNQDQMPDMTVPGWEGGWNSYWESQNGAQDGPQVTPTGSTARPVERASLLFNTPVVGQDGDALGVLKDWLIDLNGRSEYAVIEMQDQTALAPWLAVVWDQQKNQFMLNVAREVVENAPPYREGARSHEEGGTSQARGYWGEYVSMAAVAGPLPTATETDPQAVPASKVINSPVVSFERDDLGTISDIILTADGAVQYVVVQNGGQFRPVPWMNFEMDMTNLSLLYIDDPIRLDQAPGFVTIEEMPFTTAGWDREIRAYWGLK